MLQLHSHLRSPKPAISELFKRLLPRVAHDGLMDLGDAGRGHRIEVELQKELLRGSFAAHLRSKRLLKALPELRLPLKRLRFKAFASSKAFT